MNVKTTERYEVARRVLSRIAHPVTIVAAANDTERACATGTVMYVSLAPAMVAIAEHVGSKTSRVIRETGEFSVSLLHDAQQDIASAAGHSAPGNDKFAALKIPTIEPPAGFRAPGVAGSLAVLWCTIVNTVETGDHILVVGDVREFHIEDRRWDPLLRYARRYFRIGHSTSEESPEGYPT